MRARQYIEPRCIPNGQNCARVAKAGPAPEQIVQNRGRKVCLYETDQFASLRHCREHERFSNTDQAFNGLPVGCWEKDPGRGLLGFHGQEWLHWSGDSTDADGRPSSGSSSVVVEGDVLIL